MKKTMTALLAALMVLSFASCNNSNSSSSGSSSASSQVSSQEPASSEESKAESTIKDSLALLDSVWNSFKEDDKFPIAGGDMTEENMTDGTPGIFGLADAAELDRMLGFPQEDADKIDGAASIYHMMNLNTFTCGAFHVKDAANIDSLTAALKDNIMKRQWICGFPDKLVVAVVDDYIVSFFGAEDLVDEFRDQLTAVYSSAKVAVDSPIE